MLHPVTGVEFTDRYGRPINIGDKVVYPLSNYNNAVSLEEARIDKIVPLVEGPQQTAWHGRGYIPFYREDQLGRDRATEYRPHGEWDDEVKRTNWLIDYSKAYVLTVAPMNSKGEFHGKRKGLTNAINVILLP